MADAHPPLQGFAFHELFDAAKLHRLDALFLDELKQQEPECYETLLQSRKNGQDACSESLIAVARQLENFLIDLFGIESEYAQSRQQTQSHEPVFYFKKWYIQRRARRRLRRLEDVAEFSELDAWLNQELQNNGFAGNDKELAVAELGKRWLENKETDAEQVEKLVQWCIRVLLETDAAASVQGWTAFNMAQQISHDNLVPVQLVDKDNLVRIQGETQNFRRRDGFKLTDKRMSRRQVQGEIDYCVYCHDKGNDYCAKGFPQKKDDPAAGLKNDPFGHTLTGCPLEEKISEMHVLKRDAYGLGALAMLMLDNPMCPVTGHRICNDCMKACIYQKQTPVNIPQIETRILSDVLDLPWGVEIYDLLTRWNPLRSRQWVAKPYNGLKVLVAGMGPAGFTLAHHLLMEGCAVVGIDGLKIEPLARHLIEQPVKFYHALNEGLDERVMTGFGGVAEYGITVRWDKNFLRLIYLNLLRRPYFQVYGHTRFGGTVTVEDAWQLGFDHVSIAVGAGLPQALPIPGSLARGMRQANDFLMALQLSGAAKAGSLANLQVRLPAIVIGGGLTGVDAATEMQAYYIVQVEKILYRYEKLEEAYGEAFVRQNLDEEANLILDEYLAHGKAVRALRQATPAGGETDFLPLIRSWGGVTVVYRRGLRDSPAYQRNHEEVCKALEEGIYYLEGMSPGAVKLDRFGHVAALQCRKRLRDEDGNWRDGDGQMEIPARTILVATGARPNVAYEFEHRGTFKRNQFEYRSYALQHGQLVEMPSNSHCKEERFGPFTSYQKEQQRVSFIGDTHPLFHGSVVKAVASAMRTYPHIMQSLQDVEKTATIQNYENFRARLKDLLETRVQNVQRHTDSVVELTVYAPMAAQHFKPGQFFRLQNFETQAFHLDGNLLQTESIALLAAHADPDNGLITLMVLEEGTSSRLCATFKPGRRIALMGPSGVRTRIADGGETDEENILFIGGRLGAAGLLAVGPALRAAGKRVLYFAPFDDAQAVYCRDKLEAASDAVVWITPPGATALKPVRPQDISFTGTIEEALLQYAQGAWSDKPPFAMTETDRIMVVGGTTLIRPVQKACTEQLRPYLVKSPSISASVHAPMQCALKGVCAQCLHWQLGEDGRRSKAVFACSWHNQPIQMVDWDNVDERLQQNHVQEQLSKCWLDYLFKHFSIDRV